MLSLATIAIALAVAPLAAAQNILLKPAVHPAVDQTDVTNLHATKDASLHYDSDANPQTDSTVATVSAPSAAYPLVQLENTGFVKSFNCGSGAAQIVFTDAHAFQAAVADWQSHDQFVIASYHPNCGNGYANNHHDFALASNVTSDPSAMTLNANMKPIDMETAMGGKTPITTTFGKFTAPANSNGTGLSKRASKSEQLTWNEFPTSTLSDSKWGSGFQMYSGSEMQLICVNCGTQGNVQLTGTVEWTTSDGITDANLVFGGSMSVTVEIGMDATGISKTIPIGKKSLAQVPLGAISIPKVMTLGPQLDISAQASVTISATGSVLVGAKLDWPNMAATLVLKGSQQSGGSGWEPSVQPVSQVQGTVAASLNVDLPVELGVGINLLNGKYNKTGGVIDTPTLKLTAAAGNAPPCQGIGLSADILNNVNADVFGLTTIPIASQSTQLVSTCLGGSVPTTTPTPGNVGRRRVLAEKVRNGLRYRQIAQ